MSTTCTNPGSEMHESGHASQNAENPQMLPVCGSFQGVYPPGFAAPDRKSVV